MRNVGYGFSLFSLTFILGCTDSGLSFSLTPQLSIESPSSNAEFTDPSNKLLPLKGTCPEGEAGVLITSPFREKVPCINGRWEFSMNLDEVPEGSFDLTVAYLDGSNAFGRSVTKKFQPAYLTVTRSERSLSTAAYLIHTPSDFTVQALVYTSDEACQPSDCSMSNVELRLRSESYATAYHVTRNLYISSTNPQVAELPDGNLRVFYLSSETPTGVKQIYYRDFDRYTKTVSTQTRLTDLTGDVSQLRVLQKNASSETHLFYLSKEDCDANGCTVTRPAWRRSSDQFSSVAFPASPNQCSVSTLRAAVNQATGDLHLIYQFLDNGTCDVQTGGGEVGKPGSVEHAKYSSSAWAYKTFHLVHFPASALAVSNSGIAYLFYKTTWDNGGCAGTWATMYRYSTDDFLSSRVVSGGCADQIGYPGDSTMSGVVVGADGEVHAAVHYRYPGQPGGDSAIVIGSSADGFSTHQKILESDFSAFHFFPTILKTPSGYEVFTLITSGSNAGLTRAIVTGGSTSSINLTGSQNNTLKPVLLGVDQLGFIGQSKEWCQSHGCSNSNFYLEDAITGVKTWLTQITQSDLQLGSPQYARMSGGDDKFFYASNEASSGFLRSAMRSSADAFVSKSDLLLYNSSSFSSPTGMHVGPDGTIHLATYQSDGYIYMKSTDSFGSGVKVSYDSIGSSNFIVRGRADGTAAALWGGNGGGSWSAKIRWSTDGFASNVRHYNFEGSVKYGGRTIIWNPNGDLEAYRILDANSDGRNDIIKESSADGFASMTTAVGLSNKSICHVFGTSKEEVIAAYDSDARLYLLYAASDDGSNVCKLYMKRSDDLSKTWSISYNSIVGYDPLEIFIRSGTTPTVCARTIFSMHCFDTAPLIRQAD